MKNKSLFIPSLLLLAAFLLALVTCKKELDPNIETFEITKENLMAGTTSVTIEGTYNYPGVIDGIKACVSENGASFGEFDVELEEKDFSVTITGLVPATEYQYHYAVDYGFEKPFITETKTFTTTSEAPTVKIVEVQASEDSTSFRIVCKVEDDGGSEVTSRGICWSATFDHPTMNDDTISDPNGGSGEYNIDLGPEVLSSSTKYYVRAYAKNARGLGLSEPADFRTAGEITKPEVTTVEVSEVTYNSAYCLCNVRSDGGLELEGRGISYYESSNPGLTINIAAEEVSLGEFLVQITGLQPSKEYHVHAYATNDKGTGEDEGITFTTTDGRPTVTTLGITDINETSATGGGNVTDQGYTPVTERGICWSTHPAPEISDFTYPNGTGEGSYPGYMTDLTADQTYYVRAYAKNSQGLSYGEEVQFAATDGLPEVRTLDVTDIYATTAKAHGEVTDEGASPVTERGICWSATNPIPTIDDEHKKKGSGLGAYEVDLTNLSPGTTYYVRAYAKNNESEVPAYGTSIPFETEATCPTVETVGIDGTTVSGNVTDDGGKPVSERGACWCTNDDPTLHYVPCPTAGTGPYSVELPDLEPGKTYKVKAYARNSVCPAYGEELPLTMEADPPTVQTLQVSNIGQNSATGNGNVTNDGGASITERGVCWGTNQHPDLNDSHAVSEETPGTGTFTARMNGLTPSTHYYVRAYAKNSAGKIGYGDDKEFTTSQSVSAPTVITLAVTEPITTTATGNGNVTDDGGSPITERGVCWGTNHNPDLNGSYNSCTTNGTGTYQVSMTGLTPGTTYYVRAYARNEAGLSYAENEVSFSTGAQQYTVTVSASTGGSAHVGSPTGPTTGTYTNGQQCTVYAVANSNYTFTNWTEVESGNVASTQANYTFTVTGNRNLRANFNYTPPQTYTITVSANPSNGGTAHVGSTTGPTTGTFTQGQSCTIYATANEHYTFTNWKKGNSVVSTNATYTFDVTESATYTAYFTQDPQYTITATANPTNGGTVTGGGTYYAGTTVNLTANTYSGFTFDHWQDGNTNNPRTITVTGNATYTAYFEAQPQAPQGAINGLFTIDSIGNQVYFSKGNLQYIGSANTPYWKFADNQWDYLGTTTGQNSTSQNVDRDLFGWGTSGWDSGNTYYHPWDTDNSDGSLYGPPGQYNLTGSYAQADWGEYNSIYSGSTATNGWRTLTREEWVYVFQGRSGASSKYGHGKVNGQRGMILLPDEWTLPSGMSFTPGNSSWVNEYTTGQWEQMEQNGAVFLPAAGYRYGTSVGVVGSHGLYWSASCNDSDGAYYVSFHDSYLNPQSMHLRCDGLSVRLVCPAEN